MNRKPNANSPLNKLPPERAEAIDSYALNHTLDQTVRWAAGRGVKTSMGALSSWLKKRRLRQSFLEAESSVMRVMDLMTRTFPQIDEREFDRRANLMFQMKALEDSDRETYLTFSKARQKSKLDQARLDQRDRVITQARDKWLASQRTKIEAGLDALYLEVKDNQEARELFQKFKAVATKATT